MKFFIPVLSLFVCLVSSLAQEVDEGSNDIRRAPNFEAETLSGNYVSLDEYIGEGPVLLTFWATWCTPCIAELKHYNEFYNKYKSQGLKIVAISTDSEKTINKVKPFIRSNKYDFTVLLDPNSNIARTYYVQTVPFTFLINRDGEIVYSHSGYMKGDEKITEDKIKGLLSTN